MEQLKVLMNTVDVLNNTDAVLDVVENMVKDSGCHGSKTEDTDHAGHAQSKGDVPLAIVPCTQCSDSERAILSGYVSLMRQCIELAKKVGAAKA